MTWPGISIESLVLTRRKGTLPDREFAIFSINPKQVERFRDGTATDNKPPFATTPGLLPKALKLMQPRTISLYGTFCGRLRHRRTRPAEEFVRLRSGPDLRSLVGDTNWSYTSPGTRRLLLHSSGPLPSLRHACCRDASRLPLNGSFIPARCFAVVGTRVQATVHDDRPDPGWSAVCLPVPRERALHAGRRSLPSCAVPLPARHSLASPHELTSSAASRTLSLPPVAQRKRTATRSRRRYASKLPRPGPESARCPLHDSGDR